MDLRDGINQLVALVSLFLNQMQLLELTHLLTASLGTHGNSLAIIELRNCQFASDILGE